MAGNPLERVLRLPEGGIERERTGELLPRVFGPPEAQEQLSQIETRFRIIGLERQSPSILLERFAGAAGLVEGRRQVPMSDGRIRLQIDGPLDGPNGFVGPVLLGQTGTQVQLSLGVGLTLPRRGG